MRDGRGIAPHENAVLGAMYDSCAIAPHFHAVLFGRHGEVQPRDVDAAEIEAGDGLVCGDLEDEAEFVDAA